MGREDAAVGSLCPCPRRRCSTTAPAPSPNSTQVPRSFQSRMREKVSAPITSARCAWPSADEIVGDRQRIDEAGADRLHVEGDAPRACRARPGPRSRWPGKVWSGVAVAEHDAGRRRRPSTPACVQRLRAAACVARSEVSSPSAAMWRWRMPVRSPIHSSEVSTRCASSSLVTTRWPADSAAAERRSSAGPCSSVGCLSARRAARRRRRQQLREVLAGSSRSTPLRDHVDRNADRIGEAEARRCRHGSSRTMPLRPRKIAPL